DGFSAMISALPIAKSRTCTTQHCYVATPCYRLSATWLNLQLKSKNRSWECGDRSAFPARSLLRQLRTPFVRARTSRSCSQSGVVPPHSTALVAARVCLGRSADKLG